MALWFTESSCQYAGHLQMNRDTINYCNFRFHRCWCPGTSAPVLTQSCPDTGSFPYFTIKASVSKFELSWTPVKNWCWGGNVFAKIRNHYQPEGIIESLGRERYILENPPLLLCDWAIKQIVPTFLTFFVISISFCHYDCYEAKNCFKMLQGRVKLKIFCLKEWEKENKRGNGKILIFKNSKFQF